MTGPRPGYDLGLIIPTREEFDYLRESVPFTPLRGQDKGFWYEFEIPRGRRGVAHVLFDMGLTPTTAAAGLLLANFDPEVLVVIGIGGSLSADLRLGDVVIGSVIHEYLKEAKISSDGQTIFEPAGDGWPLTQRMRNFTNNFRYFAEPWYESWVRFARTRGVEAELPFATTPGARAEPEYFVLPIASGDAVVADPAFKAWLLSHHRRRAAVDMESAGAARAVQAYDRDVALLACRGISDFADEGKAALDKAGLDIGASGQGAGAWRRYAARNAIELLLAFLASPSFPWRTSTGTAAGERGVSTLAEDNSGRSAPPSLRAWDFFMQAAQVVNATSVGFQLLRAVRSSHPWTADGGHGGHGDDALGAAHGAPHGSQGHGPDHDSTSDPGQGDAGVGADLDLDAPPHF